MPHAAARLLRAGLIALIAGLALASAAGKAGTEDKAASVSLLDQQLLAVIQRERELDAAAAAPDAEEQDIQRRFHEVARTYASILARNPDHLESRLLYGKLLSRFGDIEGARLQFLRAAQIDPKIAVIHQQLSTLAAEEGDFSRALAYALNAVRLEPGTAAYHFGLGQILAAFRDQFLKEGIFTAGKLDADLLAAFAKAKELQPDALPLQFRYGEAFYDVAQPDWTTALAHWQALAANPALSPLEQDAVRLHQARCLLNLGRADEARQLAATVNAPELQASRDSLFPPAPEPADTRPAQAAPGKD